jgi:hypothetical protein
MILRAGNVNGGIGGKEICWTEVDLMYLNRPKNSISIYVPSKATSGVGSYMTGQSSTLGLCLEFGVSLSTYHFLGIDYSQ